MSPPLVWSLLSAIVCLGFATETALGFGAMVVSLALGAQLVPLEALFPTVVPLNVALSLYLAARNAAHIDRRFLVRRLLPPVLVGVPLGLLAFARLPRALLVRSFGGFVVLLASIELFRTLRRGRDASLGRAARIALLVLGGAVHGAFATGGPMVVYVASRELTDKHRFRATLSALWALLGVGITLSLVAAGSLGAASLRGSGILAPAALVGLLAGEMVHRRVRAERLRVAVFVMLLVAGTLLLRG